MVMPLPEIPSDVLSLLEGDFKDLQATIAAMLKHIGSHTDDIGTLRGHNWVNALTTIVETINQELACDECQTGPYQLGLWPIGRGHWVCEKHYQILKEKGLL